MPGAFQRNHSPIFLRNSVFSLLMSQCPVTCGGGLRARSVRCLNKKTGKVTQGCERNSRPLAYQACALTVCPPDPGNVALNSQTISYGRGKRAHLSNNPQAIRLK